VAALGLAEIAVRLLGGADGRGGFRLGQHRALPYALPVRRYAGLVAATERRADDAYARDDAELGWTIAARATHRNGLYAAEGHGIRAASSAADCAATPEPGVLRVGLFGDSSTHRSEVAFEETWGRVSERALEEREVPAEVLNFGVGGYGTDQALLRLAAPRAPVLLALADDPTDLFEVGGHYGPPASRVVGGALAARLAAIAEDVGRGR